MTSGNDLMNEAAQSICNKVLRAQVQVNQTIISTFYIKELQDPGKRQNSK